MQVPNATADISAARFKVHAGPGGDLSSVASDSASAASSAASSSSSTVESSAPAGLAWAQESTNGKNREIKFINQSGHSIYHIYAWTTDQSESDGHDLMGPEVILTGQTRT